MKLHIKRPFVKYDNPGLACEPGSSKTKQSFKDESNIDKIIAKYQKTGVINFRSQYAQQYGEMNVQDYKTSLDIIRKSESMFQELPSTLRDRFENSPEEFLEFVQDKKTIRKMFDLGLTSDRPPVETEPLPTKQDLDLNQGSKTPILTPKKPKSEYPLLDVILTRDTITYMVLHSPCIGFFPLHHLINLEVHPYET